MIAMILAAGLGSRLGELTDSLPKPLIPICNTLTLIDFNIERLAKAGIKDFVVNVHYLGDKVKKHLTTRYPDLNIKFSHENELLGTGGGIANAKKYLLNNDDEDDDILIVNSDTLFFIDINLFINIHKDSDACVTLSIQPCQSKYRTVSYNNASELTGFYGSDQKAIPGCENSIKKGDTTGEFIGIHIVKKAVVRELPEGIYSILSHYIGLLQKGKSVKVSTIANSYWEDLGTPERLEKGRKLIKILKDNEENLGSLEDIMIERLPQGLSSKIPFRVTRPDLTSKVLITHVVKEELQLWYYATAYVRDHSTVKMPEVFTIGDDWMIMEDAGKNTLLDITLANGLESSIVKNFYLSAIKQAVSLSKIDVANFPIEFCYPVKIYQLSHIRYDLNLFNDYFLTIKLNDEQIDLLSSQILNSLNLTLISIMHRDFQSTNILVNYENTLTVIDISTIRIGYGIYDIVSLLLDSYLPLRLDFIEEMKQYYFDLMGFDQSYNHVFWLAAFLRITHDIGVFEREGKKNKSYNAILKLIMIINNINIDDNICDLILNQLIVKKQIYAKVCHTL